MNKEILARIQVMYPGTDENMAIVIFNSILFEAEMRLRSLFGDEVISIGANANIRGTLAISVMINSTATLELSIDGVREI